MYGGKIIKTTKKTDSSDKVLALGLPTSDELCAEIRGKTDRVMLSFSCGKDSIAAWVQLEKFGFKEIIPVYLEVVPGLEFVEANLAYYEKVFGTHIVRIPHPSFYRFLKNGVYQSPLRAQVIEDWGLPKVDYDTLFDLVAAQYKVPLETRWMATGVRWADSMDRRTSIKAHGIKNELRRTFFAVWDWNRERMFQEFAARKVLMPTDYRVWGLSFDGLDLRFMARMKTAFPRDYAKIIDWFPLIDADMWRRKYAGYGEEYYT